jgi:ribosomal protein L37AE/L43A
MPTTTTKSRKQVVVVKDTNHPAAFNKIRCPKCGLGYAVRGMTKTGVYTCSRCRTKFSVGTF